MQISKDVLSPHTRKGEMRRALIYLICIFVASVSVLAIAYYNFPKLEKSEEQYVKLPRNIDDAKLLGQVLSRYKDRFYYQVLAGVFATYIFLQTFAIPGSIFLSIISGFLFPFPLALGLVCFCSAVGATFCYLLSYLVGRPAVQKYIPDRVAKWAAQVERHRHDMFYYIVFLRVTPFLPNWFINICSPVLNVDLSPFFWGTFFGVAPPSFLAIQAGTTLQQLTSSTDTITWRSVLVLALVALVSLSPTFFRRRLQRKFD